MSRVYFIHDFDNCLVMQLEHTLKTIVDVYTRTALAHGSPFDYAETERILVDNFVKTGLGHTAFAQYGIDVDALYHEVHETLFAEIDGQHDAEAYAIYEDLLSHPSHVHCVLTHGTTDWALNNLRATGLGHLFHEDQVIGLDKMGADHPKSKSPRGFQLALDSIGLSEADIPHTEIYFTDDSAINHPIPHEMGLLTVHVGPKVPEYMDAEYIRYRAETLACFLKTFQPHLDLERKTKLGRAQRLG